MFKIGDKVKCLANGGYSFLEKDHIYTVLDIDHDHIKLDLMNGWYWEKYFELAGPFKVGDKVRCINNDGCQQEGLNKGSIYIVEELGGFHTPHIVVRVTKNGEEHSYGYKVDRFELVEEPKAFKVGEWVRCIDTKGYSYIGVGVEFQVVEVNDDCRTIRIKTSEGPYWYSARLFELVIPKTTTLSEGTHNIQSGNNNITINIENGSATINIYS